MDKLYKFKFVVSGTDNASISVAENTFSKAVEKARDVASIVWPSHEVCLSSVVPNN